MKNNKILESIIFLALGLLIALFVSVTYNNQEAIKYVIFAFGYSLFVFLLGFI
jgi:hypothetical protein